MKNLPFLFLAIIISFFACNEDPLLEQANTLVLSMNGEPFQLSSFDNFLHLDDGFIHQSNGIYTQAFAPTLRLNVRSVVDGGTLSFTVSNWDFQNNPENSIALKSYITNESISDPDPITSCTDGPLFPTCDVATATYEKDGKMYTSYLSGEDEKGYVEITANDHENRTVSGLLDFKLVSTGEGDQSTLHFQGVFNELNY